MFSMQFREVVCSLCFLCVLMFSLCFDVSGISMSEFERARDSQFFMFGCWRKHVFDIVWHFLLLTTMVVAQGPSKHGDAVGIF